MDSIANNIQGIFAVVMNTFLEKFEDEVKLSVDHIIGETLDIFTEAKSKFILSPTRPFYSFNARDVKRVMEGICMIKPQQCSTKDQVYALWLHEICRVVGDRMCTPTDLDEFRDFLLKRLERSFVCGISWTIDHLTDHKVHTYSDLPILLKTSVAIDGEINEEEEDLSFLSELAIGGFVGLNDNLDESITSKSKTSSKNTSDLSSLLTVGFNRSQYTVVDDWPVFVDQLRVFENNSSNLLSSRPGLSNVNSSIVFFDDAIMHICRLARILSLEKGHSLLIGVDGTGRSTVVRLVALLRDLILKIPDASLMNDGMKWGEFLRDLVKKAVLENKGVLIYLKDSLVAAHLNAAEQLFTLIGQRLIPVALFGELADDELLRPLFDQIAKEMNLNLTVEKLHNVMQERIWRNLRLVMAFSPHHFGLMGRIARDFPTLMGFMQVDSYGDWSCASLKGVGFDIVSRECKMNEGTMKRITNLAVSVYKELSQFRAMTLRDYSYEVHIPPKGFVRLLEQFCSVLNEKQSELETTMTRLKQGINTLEGTNVMVHRLEDELKQLQPVLEEKKEETKKLLETVKRDQNEAEDVRSAVLKEEELVRAQAERVAEIQAEAQEELDAALPMLNEAIAALDALDKSDIIEVKSFTNPPEAVRVVMQAVSAMLSESTLDWDTAKRILGDMSFVMRLREYDKDNIPDKIIRKVSKILVHPMMQVENVKTVSKAATSLCMWVHAMIKYSFVAKEVRPKQLKVEEMNSALKKANRALEKKQRELHKVEKAAGLVQQRLDQAMEAQQQLEDDSKTTQLRLSHAAELTGSLAEEQIRWKDTVKLYESQLAHIKGNSFLTAAILVFGGLFPGEIREVMINEWISTIILAGVPILPDFDVVAFLSDTLSVDQWHLAGLPSDTVATQNALITLKSKCVPIIVDPQEQAIRWIQNLESSPIVLSALSRNWIMNVKAAMISGSSCIVTIGNNLPQELVPLLSNCGPGSSGVRTSFEYSSECVLRPYSKIKFGGEHVECLPSFRLYLISTTSKPSFDPSTYLHSTIINFAVTMNGLEQQFLSLTLENEHPEVEHRFRQLQLNIASDEQLLLQIQKKTLLLLSESRGDLLDDEELVTTLKRSDKTTSDIAKRLSEAEVSKKEIQKKRLIYAPVGRRMSLLYCCVADLGNMMHCYQFSLPYFKSLFLGCVSRGAGDHNMTDENKASHLVRFCTLSIFKTICNALLESHYVVFAFMIALRVLVEERREISNEQMQLLLQGPSGLVCLSKEKSNISHITSSQNDNIEKDVEIKDARTDIVLDNDESNNNNTNNNTAAVPSSLLVYFERLERLTPLLRGLVANVQENFSHWILWAQSENPIKSCLEAVSAKNLYSSGVDSEVPVDFKANQFKDKNGNNLENFQDFEKITPILRLLILRGFEGQYKDFIGQGVFPLVTMTLEEKLLRSAPTSLADALSDVDCQTPLVILAESGVDLEAAVLELMKSADQTERATVVSLSQRRGDKAARLLANCCQMGNWVILHHCHLASSFMPKLEHLVQVISDGRVVGRIKSETKANNKGRRRSLFVNPTAPRRIDISNSESNESVNNQQISEEPVTAIPQEDTNDDDRLHVHHDFRLILTAAPSDDFPISILREASKVTIELPRSYRDDMLLLSKEIEQQFAKDSPMPNVFIWRKLVLGLGTFHAIVQQRKNYGEFGWTAPYLFTQNDFNVSASLLHYSLSQLSLAQKKDIPFESLREMVNTVYSGPLTSDWDTKCLEETLKKIWCPAIVELESFSFCKDRSYIIPAVNSMDAITVYLYNLPARNSPALFGMKPSVTTAIAANESKTFFECCVNTQSTIEHKESDRIGKANGDMLNEGSLSTGDLQVIDCCQSVLSDLHKPLDLPAKKLLEDGNVADEKKSVDSKESTCNVESKRTRLTRRQAQQARRDYLIKQTNHFATTAHALSLVMKLKIRANRRRASIGKLPIGKREPDPLVVREKISQEDSYVVYLRQEIKRHNVLIHAIARDCSNLQSALHGKTAMSSSLSRMYHDLLVQRVPESWIRLAGPTNLPLASWRTRLSKQCEHLNEWLALTVEGQRPACLWIGAFMFPQGLKSAILLDYSIRKHLPLDTLHICHHALRVKEASELPQVVNGESFAIPYAALHIPTVKENRGSVNNMPPAAASSIQTSTTAPTTSMAPSPLPLATTNSSYIQNQPLSPSQEAGDPLSATLGHTPFKDMDDVFRPTSRQSAGARFPKSLQFPRGNSAKDLGSSKLRLPTSGREDPFNTGRFSNSSAGSVTSNINSGRNSYSDNNKNKNIPPSPTRIGVRGIRSLKKSSSSNQLITPPPPETRASISRSRMSTASQRGGVTFRTTDHSPDSRMSVASNNSTGSVVRRSAGSLRRSNIKPSLENIGTNSTSPPRIDIPSPTDAAGVLPSPILVPRPKDRFENSSPPPISIALPSLPSLLSSASNSNGQNPPATPTINRMASTHYHSYQDIDGVFISGLTLAGAGWDHINGCLVESNPDQLYQDMPLFHFRPQEGHPTPSTHFNCPVYFSNSRKGTPEGQINRQPPHIDTIYLPCQSHLRTLKRVLRSRASTTGFGLHDILERGFGKGGNNKAVDWALAGVALSCDQPE
eukprot:TRINITY_DN7716_c0_g4_i1.p1 TRINITY_DN7716_c0_g4~~TRINITY_DN7716_c0_g4_i1.p1  ORF type:complete len:2866 (-),score=629.04 TRINITY_DN7716_c0_g4_i1:292-8106(-)